MKPIRFLPKIQRGQACLNCALPLAGEENFCPNCGQRNDTRSLNFGSFLHAIFSEFISYDSRLWRTIKVLLLKPGQVSRDYINGKRFRYANPFRFYLTISIVFFVLLGAVTKYDELKGTEKTGGIIQIGGFSDDDKKAIKDTNKEFDSIIKANPNNKDLQTVNTVVKTLQPDSTAINLNEGVIDSLFKAIGNKRLIKYNDFYETHKTFPVEEALDSLGESNSSWNKFYYTRVGDFKKLLKDKGTSLNKKIMSNLSIALFVFLPIFAMFIKLLYVRRGLNYMEHLVFVFNTHSVFFLLMILVLGINLFTNNDTAITIFITIFLIYLYLALFKFYKQGWFKTLVKFSILNLVFVMLSTIGIIIVSVISFLID